MQFKSEHSPQEREEFKRLVQLHKEPVIKILNHLRESYMIELFTKHNSNERDKCFFKAKNMEEIISSIENVATEAKAPKYTI